MALQLEPDLSNLAIGRIGQNNGGRIHHGAEAVNAAVSHGLAAMHLCDAPPEAILDPVRPVVLN